MESHRWCDKVQDAYSLRCAPQVHGASRDLLDYVEYTVTTELNAATDNPLVLVDDDMLVSAGNFHGQPLAFALDALAMAVAELASISERRVERLVNPNLSDGLPAFLTTDGGLNSGFMIPQYVAASLVSENKSLCHPASVDSIPTSAGQEDHVSMGNAVRAEGVAGGRELGARARDRAARGRAGGRVPRAARAGRGAAATHEFVRSLSPRLRDDRPLGPDIESGRRRGPGRLAARRRRGGSGGARMSRPRRLQWGVPEQPPPKHPYRDTLIMYGVFSVLIVLVAWATGGGVRRAFVIAILFFVVASAWSISRWRNRLREESEEARAREEHP